MSENESEEENKSDVEMKEENEIILKDTSLLDQLSTIKYNYDTNENKEIVFYNYIPMNENFTVQKTKYFELIQKTEKKINAKTLKNIKNFLYLEKNPLNILPNKNNLDLKRNIAPRLKYLNQQTEIAILEIMKENIKKNKQIDKVADLADKQMKKDMEEFNKEE